MPQGELASALRERFGLGPLEVDAALLVLGVDLDGELQQLFAAVTFAPAATEQSVLVALVPDLETRLAAIRILGPSSRLVRRCLLRNEDGRLVATRRLRAVALGHDVLGELPDYTHVLTGEPDAPPWVASPLTIAAAMWRDRAPGSLCLVSGTTGSGKTAWARALGLSMSRPALHVDLAAAAATGRAVTSELRELLEDAALAGTAVVLDNATALVGIGTRFAAALADTLDEVTLAAVLVVEDVREVDPRVAGRAVARVDLAAPPPAVRRQLWKAIAGIDDARAGVLAAELVLTPRQIANAGALVERAGIEPLAAAIEQLGAGGKLTVADPATARLDSLILPADTRAEIVEVIGAIRSRWAVLEGWALGRSSRGRGITALFDGDSGTGKTLACEVIAAEVGLPLMRVSVASLVDKYVGETEKNLTRVFAEARRNGGILFFDEADALFGTRTDVGRAQDRYANLETNLLLQLMEEHSGVVLLTTNLKRNIDQAFMRRITYKVYFDTPESPEREQLWRLHVPKQACGGSVDVGRLAHAFELTGGSIRAAAMRAAYRAAAASRRIDMNDLVECAKLEVAGMGRVASFQ